MIRKLGICVILIVFSLSLYGCIALLAGAAGGAGAAVWLSGKLSQQVNASFDRTVAAAKSGLESLRLEVTKETVKADVAQIISSYTDGRTIWIDIRRITDLSSQIEVRVGATSRDKQAAQKVLNQIMRYL